MVVHSRVPDPNASSVACDRRGLARGGRGVWVGNTRPTRHDLALAPSCQLELVFLSFCAASIRIVLVVFSIVLVLRAANAPVVAAAVVVDSIDVELLMTRR